MRFGLQSALTRPSCSIHRVAPSPARLSTTLGLLMHGRGFNNLPDDVPSERLSGAAMLQLDLWTRALPHLATYLLRACHTLGWMYCVRKD